MANISSKSVNCESPKWWWCLHLKTINCSLFWLVRQKTTKSFEINSCFYVVFPLFYSKIWGLNSPPPQKLVQAPGATIRGNTVCLEFFLNIKIITCTSYSWDLSGIDVGCWYYSHPKSPCILVGLTSVVIFSFRLSGLSHKINCGHLFGFDHGAVDYT